MNINNFNRSSTGVNLEYNCSYDNDLASMWFDGSFKVLRTNSYSQNTLYVYGAHIADLSDFDLDSVENYKINDSKALLRALLKQECLTDLSEVKDFMQNVGTTSDTLQDIIDSYCASYGWEAQEVLEDNFEVTFAKIESRGYSQGDYAEVIIPECILKELGSDLSSYQDEIDHLIWDRPYYCELIINDESINVVESVKDMYKWDREEVEKIIKDSDIYLSLSDSEKSVVDEFLTDNLDEPKYLY